MTTASRIEALSGIPVSPPCRHLLTRFKDDPELWKEMTIRPYLTMV